MTVCGRARMVDHGLGHVCLTSDTGQFAGGKEISELEGLTGVTMDLVNCFLAVCLPDGSMQVGEGVLKLVGSSGDHGPGQLLSSSMPAY